MFTIRNLSKVINNFTPKIFIRNYQILQPDISILVSDLNVTKLNDYTKNVITYSSVLTPKLKVPVTIHQMDLVTRTEFQKYDFDAVVKKNFSVSTFFDQFPSSGVVPNNVLIDQKKILYARGNAITEICAAKILPKISNVTKVDIAFCWKNQVNMTNQNEPDFAMAALLYNGCVYQYRADLKTTTLFLFSQKLNGLHPGKIYYNVYYLYDCPADYSFCYNDRVLLQAMYYDSLNYHFYTKNPHAVALSKENQPVISKFMSTGYISDYNKISLNTPKILTPQDFIDNF